VSSDTIQGVTFATFWESYPVKKGKPQAGKAWGKLSPSDQQAALDSVARHRVTRQWQDPQYIPHASTFLNQARWTDEIAQSELEFTAAEQTLLRDWRRRVGSHNIECRHEPMCQDQETCDRIRVNTWRREGRL
jgi:hypothetical protein